MVFADKSAYPAHKGLGQVLGEGGRTVLDKMILRQARQRACASDTLPHEETGSDGDLLSLDFRPTIHVLEQIGKHRLLKRALEVLVSVHTPLGC